MAAGLVLGFSQSAMCLGKKAPTPAEQEAMADLVKFRDTEFKTAMEDKGIKGVTLEWDDSFVSLYAKDEELGNAFLSWVKTSVPSLMTMKLNNDVRQKKITDIKKIRLGEDGWLTQLVSVDGDTLDLRIDGDDDLDQLQAMNTVEFAERAAPSVAIAGTDRIPTGASHYYQQ